RGAPHRDPLLALPPARLRAPPPGVLGRVQRPRLVPVVLLAQGRRADLHVLGDELLARHAVPPVSPGSPTAAGRARAATRRRSPSVHAGFGEPGGFGHPNVIGQSSGGTLRPTLAGKSAQETISRTGSSA